jgi:hypothetical protein
MHGSRTSDNFLRSFPILATLCGIVLVIYLYLKKVITYNLESATPILDLLKKFGLNDNLSAWALSQFAHETKGFTSDLYYSNNNVCGMKFASQALSIGEKNGYANYTTIDNSVQDFVNWYSICRNNIFSLPLYISNLSDYVSFLKNNDYFEADEAEYLKGCQFFYDKMFK